MKFGGHGFGIWAGAGAAFLVVVYAVFHLFRVEAQPGVAAALLFLAGIGGGGLLFALADRALAVPWRGGAVARVVLRESLRRRLAPVTLAILLLLVIALGFKLQGEQLLHYRMRSVLTYSFELIAIVLSLTTLFLACSTLANETHHKHAHTTLTKPIRRFEFLIGKWLGILAMNAVLLMAVGGVLSAVCWIQWSQATDPTEVDKVSTEVLSARRDCAPQPDPPLLERAESVFLASLARRRDQNPLDPVLQDAGLREMEWARVYRSESIGSRHVSPGEREVYLFEGIDPSDEEWDALRLRVEVDLRYRVGGRPALAADRDFVFEFSYNGAEPRRQPLLHDEVALIPLDRTQVAEDGTLRLEIHNPDPEGPTLILSGDHAIEVLYPTGSFGMNLVRALLVLWMRLAFLAALGLAAASFLSFPVASLVVVILAGVAGSAEFIVEDREVHSHSHSHGPVQEQRADLELVEKFVDSVDEAGQGLARWLLRFSQYSPTERIADGRSIPWSEVWECLRWIGGAWAGGALLFGAFLFSRRELARVQV